MTMKALPLTLLLLSGAALADDAGMPDHAIMKCRALGDGAARLACYDAIPVTARPQAAAPAAAPVVAAAPARSKEADFGMEAKKQREAEPKSVTSTVAGDFEGWGPTSQIRLANGQVWRIIDGSQAALPRMRDPKVTIERNLFGTLFLKVEGTNHSAKVRRVQ
jgi:hypothetical protein